ncbi:3439_t:CDS:2, partial [Racocetra fulgida]
RTLKPNAFPIPDKYIVKTTYGKSKITITCFVEYIANRLHFKIIFGSDPDDFVCSNLSATTVANAYITVYNEKKAKKASRLLKPFDNLSNRMQINRGKNIGVNIFQDFETRAQQHFNKIDQQLAVIKAMDKNLISRAAYRSLAWINQKLRLDKKMMIDIPIQFINLDSLCENNNNSIIDIDEQEIIDEMITSIRKDPIIHIRISGDGRNVGRKIKHVMITFAILNDKSNIHYSDHHFVLLLYPGDESYNILKSALSFLITELKEIQNGFFDLA